MNILQSVTDNFDTLIPLTLFIIGIIVATSIKDTQTEKEQGDKRLVAAIFILSSIIIYLSFKLYNLNKFIQYTSERSSLNPFSDSRGDL